VIVRGCHVFGGLTVVVVPTQPDIPSSGTTVQKLTVGSPANHVPASLTTGNTDAYSSYWTFTANRAHITGQTCKSAADCQMGMTCSAGRCQ
jgi:hypothetical protein